MKRLIFVALIIVVAALFLSGVFSNKEEETQQPPVSLVKESQIRGVPFGSSEQKTIDLMGKGPSETLVASQIKRAAIARRENDIWRGRQRNNSPVSVNLGGVRADTCLSYQTNFDRWMLCFKKNKLFTKIRLARPGQPSLILR